MFTLDRPHSESERQISIPKGYDYITALCLSFHAQMNERVNVLKWGQQPGIQENRPAEWFGMKRELPAKERFLFMNWNCAIGCNCCCLLFKLITVTTKWNWPALNSFAGFHNNILHHRDFYRWTQKAALLSRICVCVRERVHVQFLFLKFQA